LLTKSELRREALVRLPVQPPACAAANEKMIASAFDYRIVGVDEMTLRTDAARELDLIEALFELHVGGIAARASDALIGRESMFEPSACGERTDEDLEVDSWSLSLLAGEEDPSVAVRVAGSGVLPASGLGMNADAGAQCVLGEVCGAYRTIAYHPPLDPFRVAVLVAVGFGIGCAWVRFGARHDFLLKQPFCVV